MRIINILFILNIYICFGQKAYKFDTLLEYESYFYDVELKKDTITKQFLLTNSKDNNYYILVKEDNNLNYYLKFIHYDKYASKVYVSKNDFFKASEINIDDCNTVFKYENKFKFKVKNYAFVNKSDTIINNKALKTYTLNYLLSRKKKVKKNIGTATYIIKNNTEYHLPILKPAIAFNEWNKERNIPNGIYQEYILRNYDDIITKHETLISTKKVSLTLNLIEPCPTKVIIER